MMSTVLEQPLVSPEELLQQQVQAREQAFKMPRPSRGQQILWFADADRLKVAEVGFVREVGNRSLTIIMNGIPYDTVRHIDDPILLRNEFQRQSGAWDFPENDRLLPQLRTRIEFLEKRIAEIDDMLSKRKKGE